MGRGFQSVIIPDRKILLSPIRNIVVKVGTRVLTAEDHAPDEAVIRRLADEIAQLKARGVRTTLISSGAIGAGMGRLKLRTRPKSIPQLQAAAAVGQNQLMHRYELAFKRHRIPIAQVLLNAEDVLNNRARYLNLRDTFEELFNFGAIPIVNENDSVATDEIKIGDNDTLSAHVTHLVDAKLLIILTDIDGLYSCDPRKRKTHRGDAAHAENPPAEAGEALRPLRLCGEKRSAKTSPVLIGCVERIGPEIEALAGSPGSEVGIGGMRTKIEAAKIVTGGGKMMIIANGKCDSLIDILEGQEIGTLFLPQVDKMTSRKRWIAFNLKERGKIIVDAGARTALVEKGKSLLPSGIVAIEGNFRRGDMVGIVDESNVELGRGLVNYPAAEIAKIRGRKTLEIEGILGYQYHDEVVHRDDLVIMGL
ncbi:MAG: glutamate 5-kinase [Candidatus Latescibacteria bacterium]|nr:glutamate 5-kinase [Candidatus Latescibacterota bacterium]